MMISYRPRMTKYPELKSCMQCFWYRMMIQHFESCLKHVSTMFQPCSRWMILYQQSRTRRWRKFHNRKPIGELGCCESWIAEGTHWWSHLCIFLSIDLSIYLPQLVCWLVELVKLDKLLKLVKVVKLVRLVKLVELVKLVKFVKLVSQVG